MEIRRGVFLKIFLILYIPWMTNQQLQTVMQIGQLASWSSKFLTFLKTGRMELKGSKMMETCSVSRPFKDLVFTEISEAVPVFSQELEHIRKVINTRFEKLEAMLRGLVREVDIDDRISHLRQKMGIIDDQYKAFKNELEIRTSTFDEGNLCQFASSLLRGSGLSSVVDEMHNIVVPSAALQPTLLTLIVESFSVQDKFACDVGHSTLDHLHALYMALLTVEIKAFILEAFAHHFLSSYSGIGVRCHYLGTSADIATKMAHDQLMKHLRAYNLQFIAAMRKVPRDFRACDYGGKFIRDVTFIELEGVLQTVLQLPTGASIGNLDQSMSSCTTIDTLNGPPELYCHPISKFCAQPKERPCRGRIWQCVSYSMAQACIDKRGPRRYQWVSFSEDTRHPTCDANSKMHLSHFLTNPCLCHCMENTVDSTSTHLISLQPVKSNVAKNMVITGIRFVVKHGILQFQIQQGRLGINWRVGHPRWKPVHDIGEEIRAARLKKKIQGRSPRVKENKDFLIIKIGENNAINFDELYVPHGFVLTGVRFVLSEKKEVAVKRIEISLIATKFDYITGKLCIECKKKIIRSKVIHNREYSLHGNPTTPKFPTIPDSDPDQYITIQSSDWAIDGGQTTVPLFDAVPLVTYPPSPVGGMGLFFKKREDFSGLVSLKFFSLNYVEYMVDSERDLDNLINVTAKEDHLLKFQDNRSIFENV